MYSCGHVYDRAPMPKAARAQEKEVARAPRIPPRVDVPGEVQVLYDGGDVITRADLGLTGVASVMLLFQNISQCFKLLQHTYT